MSIKCDNGRTFVVGDLHGSIDMKKIKPKVWKEAKSLTKSDVLIQLGDFGWIWYPLGKNKEQEFWLDTIANYPYTLLVVLGNHENYDVIRQLPWTTKWGDQVQYLKRKNGNVIYFAKRGGVYNINGNKILTIGGALSVDQYHRTEGKTWWSGELHSREDVNNILDAIEEHKEVDYICTHTAPTDICWEISFPFDLHPDPVSKLLDVVQESVKYKHWHFGHWHVDRKGKDWSCHYNKLPEEL